MNNRINALNRQKATAYIIYFLTFGIMMLVGTFRDLEIDKALFNYQNSFAYFMEQYGMLPQNILKLCAYSALIASYHKVDDALDIAQSLAPFIARLREVRALRAIYFVLHHLIYASFVYSAFIGSNEFLNALLTPSAGGNLQDILVDAGVSKAVAIALWTVVRLSLVALAVFLFSRINKDALKAFELMAIAGIIAYEGIELIILLKDIFHRIRFREMIAFSHGLVDENGWTHRGDADIPREWINDTSFKAFTRWYKIGADYGVYSEPTSFPSGHTAAGSFVMLLPLLAGKFKNAEKWFLPSFAISFAYLLTHKRD